MALFNIDYKTLGDAIVRWSMLAGRAATRPVLILWYVMRSDKTSRKDKWAIFAALAYLVLPIDILNARRLPVIGWLDEVASVAVLMSRMSKYITPEIETRANEQLDRWFPNQSGTKSDYLLLK